MENTLDLSNRRILFNDFYLLNVILLPPEKTYSWSSILTSPYWGFLPFAIFPVSDDPLNVFISKMVFSQLESARRFFFVQRSIWRIFVFRIPFEGLLSLETPLIVVYRIECYLWSSFFLQKTSKPTQESNFNVIWL